MHKIFYIMGKSASGKDSIYQRICNKYKSLKKLLPYTTRARRLDEIDGESYFFVTKAQLEEFAKSGRLIELRSYNTMHGEWCYASVDDGSLDLSKYDYIAVGTLESYVSMKDYFGGNNIFPLYIEVEDGLRLERALARERMQKEPKYAELCRRFLADEKDFSEEKRIEAGISRVYLNHDMEVCLADIYADMEKVGLDGSI